MKNYWVILTTLLCLSISMQVQAVTEAAKKKYPNVLITEDYGVLNEDDLASCPWGKQKPVPISDEEGRNTNYWQCFPRNQISVMLEDTGDYEDYFGYRDTTIAYLKIKVRTPSGIVHKYDMGRGSDLSSYHRLFNRFQRLMKGEKHVCLVGDFGKIREQFAPNGEKIKTYGWILSNLKTKKGYAV